MSILSSLFSKKPVTDFKNLVENGALIIDVRSKDEFHSGHILNSINIPLDRIEAEVQALKRKNKTIIPCCRSGARSATAQSILTKAGLESYNGGPWESLAQQL